MGSSSFKQLREEVGLTQQEVADQIGKTRGYISQLESGTCDPSLKTLSALAGTLDTEFVVTAEGLDVTESTDTDFEVGDVVRLCGGGPPLTVVYVPTFDSQPLRVAFFDGRGAYGERDVPRGAVERIDGARNEKGQWFQWVTPTRKG